MPFKELWITFGRCRRRIETFSDLHPQALVLREPMMATSCNLGEHQEYVRHALSLTTLL
jgi:hypothetical protein